MVRSSLEKTATGRAAKKKGDKFELELIKSIIKYFNNLNLGLDFKYGDTVHRTEGSGSGKYDKTDMVIIDPLFALLFPFMVEAKCMEGWSFDQLMCGDPNKWCFISDLKKCRRQSRSDRCPVVMFTRARIGTFVLLSLIDVKDYPSGAFPEFINSEVVDSFVDRSLILLGTEDDIYCILEFDDFMKLAAPLWWIVEKKTAYKKLVAHDK